MNVVAAVMEREDRVLICQRRRTSKHALKWEFPGGKVEPGESPRDALKRELREELLIEAEIGEEIYRHSVRYGDAPEIELLFYRVTEFAGQPVNTEFEAILWERRGLLRQYDFLEGDLEFVRRLADDASAQGS